jgi:rod shape-determining protein MreB and related proteins
MGISFLDRFSNSIGIDLGTANTLVYVAGKGIVINEPSVVALNTKTNKVVAVGSVAKEMLGKTPAHIKTVRPILDGVVSDYEITEEMLGYLIKKANAMQSKMFAPRVVVGVPSEITGVEIKAVYDAAISAGARKVYIVEEPMAGAIGIGLPIHESVGSMVIDIGGGTSDIAVISMFGVVRSKSLKIAGDTFNNDIVNYVKENFGIIIGERSAEDAKLSVGSSIDSGVREKSIRGRDVVTGLPREIVLTSQDIAKAISTSVLALVDGARSVIQSTPPEIVSDIMTGGLYLTGGGAYVQGLAELLGRELKLPVKIAEDPLSAVAKGCGKILENLDYFKEVLIKEAELMNR